MKFLAVFVTLAAVAFGYPDTTTWTLNELSMALQNPQTDPHLIPYLEAALNEMMYALHHGEQMETITITMPIVTEYTAAELAEAIQDPNTDPAHLPYLENALNELMAAFYAGEEISSITVVIPGDLHDEEPGFIDVWPIQMPDQEHVAPIVHPTPVASSPLVQIIVNVKQQDQQQAVDVVAPEGDQPSPVHVVDSPAIWGPFI